MSPLVHGAMCAACLGLGLSDLAWLDLHAAEMSAPAVVPRERPPLPAPEPPVEPAPVALTLTSATLRSGAASVTEQMAAHAEADAHALIGFARNAEEAEGEDLRSLDAIAAELAGAPGSIAVVEGYTDRTGPSDFNQTLSERRAASIARRLASKGVSPDRLRVRGFGASHRRDEGESEEAHRRNRRVEVHVQERGEP